MFTVGVRVRITVIWASVQSVRIVVPSEKQLVIRCCVDSRWSLTKSHPFSCITITGRPYTGCDRGMQQHPMTKRQS